MSGRLGSARFMVGFDILKDFSNLSNSMILFRMLPAEFIECSYFLLASYVILIFLHMDVTSSLEFFSKTGYSEETHI